MAEHPVRIYHRSCERMEELSDGEVDLVVTSPPLLECHRLRPPHGGSGRMVSNPPGRALPRVPGMA